MYEKMKNINDTSDRSSVDKAIAKKHLNNFIKDAVNNGTTESKNNKDKDNDSDIASCSKAVAASSTVLQDLEFLIPDDTNQCQEQQQQQSGSSSITSQQWVALDVVTSDIYQSSFDFTAERDGVNIYQTNSALLQQDNINVFQSDNSAVHQQDCANVLYQSNDSAIHQQDSSNAVYQSTSSVDFTYQSTSGAIQHQNFY